MARCRFGDVVKEIKNNIDRENNPYDYYIAGGHMDSEELHIHRRGSFKTDDVGPAFIREFKKGQVLYGSRRTYLKKVAVADFDGVTANTTFVLETKDEDVLLQSILPFVMLSDSFTEWSIGKSKGSTNPYVLFSDLADYEFELPPLEKQRTLAKLLWEIDSTKCSYKDLIDKTDEVVKSQFIEMITEHSNGFKAIGDLVETKIEKVKDLPEFIHSIKYIDISSLDNERKCVTGYTEYELSKSPSRAQQVIEKGDILLSTVRPNLEGRAVNQYEGDNIVASTGFCILRAKKCEPAYIWGIISSRQFVTDICEIAHGISYPAVSDKDILGYMAPDLDDQYQKQYADILEQSDKSKFELNEAIKDLDAMYKRIIKDNLG